MAECEMCGKKVGTRRYMVEGTVMNLGLECSKYGTPMDAPAPAGSQAAVQQGLQRREQRMTSRNVYDAQTTEVLVADYGPRIHKAREAKGLSHEQLGNKVSARVPELKHIESGKLRPNDDLIKKLEKELGIALLEKVEGPAPVVSGTKKPGAGAGLTIGDILKDALDKKKVK
jgi:putative transcription factor